MRGLQVNAVGVLALQGAFAAHAEALGRIGCRTVEVRCPRDLDAVGALVVPGGESGTMSHLLATADLVRPVADRIADGMPVLGTCAGLILLSREVLDGRDEQTSFGALDVTVRRNAFGRQVDSFEADIDTVDGSFHAVFIRAPRIERVGSGVEVLGRLGEEPVWVRQGAVMATSFHPELTDDSCIHRRFVATCGTALDTHDKGDD
jgi:5'-phosphate synthase pdxT subunit